MVLEDFFEIWLNLYKECYIMNKYKLKEKEMH